MNFKNLEKYRIGGAGSKSPPRKLLSNTSML